MTWPRTVAYFCLSLFLVVAALGIQTGLRLWDEHSKANREAAVTWGTEQAALTRKQLIHALDARLGSIEHQAVAEIRHTRKVALAEIAATRDRLDDRFKGAEQNLGAQVLELQGVADRRLGETNAIITGELGRANASIEQVAKIGVPAAAFIGQLNDAAPLWLDCDHNADCVFNRWVGASRGIEQFSLAVGKHAEPQQAALTGIAQDIHTATHEFVRPRKFHEKLWAGIKTTAGLVVLALK